MFKQHLRFIFFWFCAGLLEAPFFGRYIFGNSFPWLQGQALILSAHFLASFLIFFSLPRFVSHFFTVLVFFIPGFGWMMTGLTYPYFVRGEKTIREIQWEEEFKFNRTPIHFLESRGAQSKREKLVKELDFIPLVDVMEGRDVALKRGAIERLATLRTPESVSILLHYRQDPSPEVRFYILQALARIKKELEEAIEAARAELRRSNFQSSQRLVLAKTYLESANIGFHEPMVAQNYKTEALYELSKILESEEKITEAVELMAPLLIENKDWERLEALIQKAEKAKALEEPSLSQMKVTLAFYRQEAASLVENLKQCISSPDSNWKAAANWWGVSS